MIPLVSSGVGLWIQKHPGRAEFVPEHCKAVCEEGLLHRHENLASFEQESIDAFRLTDAIDGERQIGAANRLKALSWNVRAKQLRSSEVHAGMEDLAIPFRRHIPWARLLAMSHQESDFAAQMLLAEPERLFAVSAVV